MRKHNRRRIRARFARADDVTRGLAYLYDDHMKAKAVMSAPLHVMARDPDACCSTHSTLPVGATRFAEVFTTYRLVTERDFHGDSQRWNTDVLIRLLLWNHGNRWLVPATDVPKQNSVKANTY